LVTLPLLSLLAMKKSQAMRYARTDWGVAYRSGLWTRKLSFAFYDRMQTISFNQSPFDRRWNMAGISVDTAAAGPADHLVDVAYLDAAFAQQQFRELQSMAARHRPSWG
jgi:putative membrane protein